MSLRASTDVLRSSHWARTNAWGWLFALITIAGCGTAIAQATTPPAGGPYVMRKQAIASGGQRASGDSVVLTGTAGQAQSGPAPGSGATYRLTGGFHGPVQPRPDALFANGFED